MAADAPLSAQELAELKRLHAAATQPPWCWSFVGEKSNGYVIGTGCDETGRPVSGLVGGDDVMDTVLRNPCVIGEHEAEPCDYDDPRLIVDVRNRLGALLALADRALAEARKPASDEVERLSRGDRGFIGYGQPVICTYGTAAEVYESSSAEGPHVWLALRQNSEVLRDGRAGEAHAHLSEEQARAVVARLQAWLDDIPERWGTAAAGRDAAAQEGS